MNAVTSLLLLLAFSIALLVILIALVLGRKVFRDRRESGSRRRRQYFVEALEAGESRALETAFGSVRDSGSELDLIAALDVFGAISHAALADAQSAGLLGHLEHRLDAREAATRGRAVLLLGLLRAPATRRLLQRMLADRDADVRLVACASLAAAREPEGVALLLDALADDRLAAERVIERIGKPWAVDALLEALAHLPANRPGTRLAIARALGLAGARTAEPELLDMLRMGNDEERISAARSLGSVGGEPARQELEHALADTSWPLRAQAAKALGEIGRTASVPALEALLPDAAWWVRANAANALVRLGAPGLAALERATGHPDPYARDRASETLAMTRVAMQVA